MLSEEVQLQKINILSHLHNILDATNGSNACQVCDCQGPEVGGLVLQKGN